MYEEKGRGKVKKRYALFIICVNSVFIRVYFFILVSGGSWDVKVGVYDNLFVDRKLFTYHIKNNSY